MAHRMRFTPFTPRAGQIDASFSSFRRGSLPYRQCSGCHVQRSMIAGTIFEATKLRITVCLLAMHLLGQAKTIMSMMKLSRHLPVKKNFGFRGST